MIKNKIKILEYINSNSEITRFMVYENFNDDMGFADLVDQLIEDGYISQNQSNYSICLTSKGREFIANRNDILSSKRAENIKFSISTVIAVLALITAIYSVSIQR